MKWTCTSPQTAVQGKTKPTPKDTDVIQRNQNMTAHCFARLTQYFDTSNKPLNTREIIE